MRQEIVVFRFDNPLTPQDELIIGAEFKEMLEDIRDAMERAEHHTTTQLREAVLKEVKDNLNEYIKLERLDQKKYQIRIQTETLRAFDVSLPIGGIPTTAKQLAEKIGKEFVWDIPRIVSFGRE
jgi:SpoVK/Ycf46/Vps4 family AAA+-type ATPase